MFPFWIGGIFLAIAGAVVSLEIHLLFGGLIMFAGVAVIILYKIYSPKYPVTVEIFFKRHGALRRAYDKATRLKHPDGTFFYKLKKIKDEFPAAEFKNLYPSGAGEVLMVFSPAPGEYHPAVFKEKGHKIIVSEMIEDPKDPKKLIKHNKEIEVAEINPIPDNLHQWLVLKMQRNKQRYDPMGSWDRYMPLIMIIIVAFSVIFIVYGLFNSMDPMLKSFQQASASFRAAAESNAEVVEKLGEIIEFRQEAEQSGGDLPAPPDVGS